ncbi:hypothetical protein SCLCIDRAFT_8539 [Scleroderma citrinum Foug A]|uniref:Uncharacterized protein n=1 Tax=Scleroderma citrinum Foug A TaxID=1036808 RepID=A0A0C3E897_9AGAM|nr:hypothetical protein SCLCIDRAFT_8539 [Scleroderma citrinum Foug A]
MQQNIRKLGKGSNLNPCLHSSASQLSIPTYPSLVDGDDQAMTIFDDIQLYNHMGSSQVRSFVADTIRSSTTPIQSIDPLHPSFHLKSLQPPQRIIRLTPYPPKLRPIRNVHAFGALCGVEEEHGHLAVSDVAITGTLLDCLEHDRNTPIIQECCTITGPISVFADTEPVTNYIAEYA